MNNFIIWLEVKNMKSIVIYFSKSGENSVNGDIKFLEVGNTEILAKKIAKLTKSHIFKLEPKTPYPNNYEDCCKIVKLENSDVEYLNADFKIDEYDTVFLGFPIWYRTYPHIVGTFLGKNKWLGKDVIPFCTNEENSFGIAEINLASTLFGANLKPGFAVRGYDVENCDKQLEEYLKKVGCLND